MSDEKSPCAVACGEQLRQEFHHLRRDWFWLFLFGVLLVVCGTAAVIFAGPDRADVFLRAGGVGRGADGRRHRHDHCLVLGRASGAACWSSCSSGILYLVLGFMITDKPLQAAEAMTLFIAAFCIVAGIFRVVAALTIHYPYWGWSLLNGMITFLLGVIIYHHFPESAIWVLGLLVGLEMLFHGWTWIMLSLAIKKIPAEAA